MIYTFYSFKGGVGRSMALANVAESLYWRGLRVLMVDFDLEAPGLERYFDLERARYRPDEVLSKAGLLDLLISYKDLRRMLRPDSHDSPYSIIGGSTFSEKESSYENNVKPAEERFEFPVEPLANFVVPIYERNSNGGELALIPAGRRARGHFAKDEQSRREFARYAERVRTFAWDDFYTNWDGEKFFDWFRVEAEKIADVILVDSRTGVTEMSGVCTYHLADVVIMFVTPNFQNLNGTELMARSLNNDKFIQEGRKGRPLSLLFVPSRVESGEGDKLNKFGVEFDQLFASIKPPRLKFKGGPFLDLKIPYVPYYAYVEDVAMRSPKEPKAADIVNAIETLIEKLAQLSPPESALHKNYAPESFDLKGDRAVEVAFASLPKEHQNLAVFAKLVQVGDRTDGSRDTVLRVSRDSFTSEERQTLELLGDLQLIVIDKETETDQIIRIADERILRKWKRLAHWLNENRSFLLWRQQLKTNIDQWESADRDRRALLSGKPLADARQRREKREKELNDTEKLYITESIRYQNRILLGEIAAIALAVILLAAFVSGWQWYRKQRRLDAEATQILASANNNSGLKSATEGDYKSAIDFYTSAIKLKPNYAEAFNNRGKAHLELARLAIGANGQTDYKNAAEDFKSAIKIDPNQAEAHMNLGVVYTDLNELGLAVGQLNEALQLDDKRAETYVHRGNAFVKQGNPDGAIADYTQAISIARDVRNQDYVEAYQQRGIAYKAKFDKDQATDTKDAAVSDFIHVVTITNVPGLKSEAERYLTDLLGNAVAQSQPAQTPQVYLHYNDPQDNLLITGIADELKRKGFRVEISPPSDGVTAGDVRFYYAEDKPNATKIRQVVTENLARNNFQRAIRLIFLGNYYKDQDRGYIEVWIPSLTSEPEAPASGIPPSAKEK